MMDKQCTDCRDAEHGNSSPKVDLVIVRDPDSLSRGWLKRGWMCTDHQEMYRSDGYLVKRY